MKAKRTYCAAQPPAEIVIELNALKSASKILIVNDTVDTGEEGSEARYIVTETADPAPYSAEYGTLVEAVIALRYTLGAEIALNRLPDDDPEKVEYLAFVDKAKNEAKAALE